MRIGIEAQRLFRPNKHGMDIVAQELIRNLSEIDKINEYFIFVRPNSSPCIKETKRLKIIEIEGGIYPYWEQVLLPRAVKRYKCELLHCTANTAPLNIKIPLVLTLHDIIFKEKSIKQLLSGGSNYQKFGNLYRRYLLNKVLGKCDKIITVSQFEQEHISKVLGGQNDKLDYIYNGVSTKFSCISKPAITKRVREKFNLPSKYLLFLGNTAPKKNTGGVLEAYRQYVHKSDQSLPLVITDFHTKDLVKYLKQLDAINLQNKIYLCGYVNQDELAIIYRQAEVFIYPSLRESFGIPILESMASGTPVITSNTSSMPEVAGLAAYLVNPYNPSEIESALSKIVGNTTLKEQLVQKGIKRVQKFSWKKNAEKTLKIYMDILKKYN